MPTDFSFSDTKHQDVQETGFSGECCCDLLHALLADSACRWELLLRTTAVLSERLDAKRVHGSQPWAWSI